MTLNEETKKVVFRFITIKNPTVIRIYNRVINDKQNSSLYTYNNKGGYKLKLNSKKVGITTLL